MGVSMLPITSWSASRPLLPAIAISGVWAATALPFERPTAIGQRLRQFSVVKRNVESH